MPDNVSLDALDTIQIPTLAEQSIEDELYQSSEKQSHEEHKVRGAQDEALGVAREKIRKLEIENDDLARLGPHRRKYSWWILYFVIAFVTVTFVTLLMSSYQIKISDGDAYRTLINLDKEVVVTLLATNTVQVVGLLYVVAKWLFPSKPEQKKDKQA
ncbi:MAG: hypothetical protein COA42_20460 [Alteromonadaceae bacterium]|nr:MAG: hypothetical protein COA42_20460 [Alteromonadaceae bacterium]